MTKLRTKKITSDIENIIKRYTLQTKQDYYDLFLNNYPLSIKLNRLVEILNLNEEQTIYEQINILKNREITTDDMIMLLDKYLSFKQEVGVEPIDYYELIYHVDGIKALIKDISKYPVLKDEKEIIKQVKQGDMKARYKLINSNYRLVIYIAQKYKSETLSFLDLFQEGVIGLMEAVDKYDESFNVKFSTYAGIWINRYIRSALYGSERVETIPINKVDLIYRMKKYINKYQYTYLHEPSNIEIASFLNIDERKVSSIKKYLKNTTLYDIDFDSCIDIKENEIEKQILEKDLKEKVNTVLDKLDKRSAVILKEFYGIGCEPHTLNEISQELNISKQRVGQIKQYTLSKLKNNKTIIDYQ